MTASIDRVRYGDVEKSNCGLNQIRAACQSGNHLQEQVSEVRGYAMARQDAYSRIWFT